MSLKVRYESSLSISREKLAKICELSTKIADLLRDMNDDIYHLAIMSEDHVVRGVAVLLTDAQFPRCIVIYKLITFDEYDEKPFLLKINEFVRNKRLLVPLNENQSQIGKIFVVYYNPYVYELICDDLQIV